MMNNFKVALVSHEFPPFTIGGIAINCYDLAHSLSKRKVFTTVFCGRSKRAYTEKINDYLEVVRLPYFDLSPRYLWFQMQNFRRLSNLLGDYAIWHGVNPTASAICSCLKRKMRKPFIVTIHEDRLDALKVFINSPFFEWTMGDFVDEVIAYPLDDLLIRICLKKLDHLVVPGNFTLNSIKRKYSNLDLDKVSVIHNGINFDRVKRTKKKSGWNDFSVFFYGRLVSRKGITYLLKAVALIKNDFPELQLNIIGECPLEHELKSLTLKLGLNDEVRFRGYMPNEDLIKEIEKASLVVLPSLFEGGSPFVAALEAMAREKPLVVFDLPFTREFISDMDNGVLAKPGNIKDLSDKIALLLSDFDLRRKIGQKAYESVRNKYNWDILVEKYLQIYENCLSH